MEFNVQHIFDNPDEDFELIESIYIPAGKYWDTRDEIQSSTFKGRKISAEVSVNIGKFYTGHRQEYALITEIKTYLKTKTIYRHTDRNKNIQCIIKAILNEGFSNKLKRKYFEISYWA